MAQSAPTEWAMFAAHFLALDYLRARGEADHDTASECIRSAFRVHTPRGRLAFTATLAAGAVGFWVHICKEQR